MTDFTPFSSLAGGALIGLASGLLLLVNGKIAGISGIVGGVLQPQRGETPWRLTFLAGLIGGGLVMMALMPERFAIDIDRSLLAVAAAGVLVGIGTRLGNGCTSGHGVCGNSRLSKRSLAATITFMTTGALTVLAFRSFGGAL
jgi:uncharacterized protein